MVQCTGKVGMHMYKHFRAILRNHYDGKEVTITVFIHIKLAIRHRSLNWCAGKSSYILTLSYGLEGKATIIAFLWPAEILVASKEC